MEFNQKEYANTYTQFEDERTQPVRDLLKNLTQKNVTTAVDLGCGPGNSTEILMNHFPNARINGVDSSEDMLEKAQKRLPNVAFSLCDIAKWQPTGHYDLILANASLQWVPDHHELYPRLLRCVAEGGYLAIQTPDNLNEPAHQVLQSIATSSSWSDKLSMVERLPRFSPERYFDILSPYCSSMNIWRTTYYHHLENGIDDVVEWFKGSALRPYLLQLSGDDQAVFLADYKRELEKSYQVLSDQSVLLPFPRLFINAAK